MPPTETFASIGQKGHDNFNSIDMVIVFITIYLMEHLFSGKLEVNIEIINVDNFKFKIELQRVFNITSINFISGRIFVLQYRRRSKA